MTNLDRCYNIFDLREIAKSCLPKGIFEYVDKGTEDGISVSYTHLTLPTIYSV